jgi:hypothetical protein
MTTYMLFIQDDMGETTIEAETLAQARTYAEEWTREGDWDTEQGTVWVDTYIFIQDAGGDRERVDTITVQIDPEEPECTKTSHDWQAPQEIVGGLEENPGVFGHGGGVKIYECCMHCGCQKVTDTWAQRPDTGEQGLTSVTYNPDFYQDQIQALSDDSTTNGADPNGYNVYQLLDNDDTVFLASFDDETEAHRWASRNGGYQVQYGLDGEVTNV